MPILTNPRHEKFCQARALGRTLDQAYVEAGYKPSFSAASRMSRNVKVMERIIELQAPSVERYEVTADSIAAELDEAKAFAYECKQPSAAVSAVLGKAKLFGLISDRSVVNVTHNYALMTEEEIRFELAALHAEARAIKAGVQN
jgi:hypothetical protein